MEPKYKVGDYVEYVDRYSRDLVPRMRVDKIATIRFNYHRTQYVYEFEREMCIIGCSEQNIARRLSIEEACVWLLEN